MPTESDTDDTDAEAFREISFRVALDDEGSITDVQVTSQKGFQNKRIKVELHIEDLDED